MITNRLLPLVLTVACVLCLAADAPVPDKPRSPATKPAQVKKSDRVVFVINAQGGSLQIMQDAKDNITAAIRDMRTGQSFNIVVGRDDKAIAFQKAIVPPTEANKAAAGGFLEKVTSGGVNHIAPAIAASVRMNPDVIWLVDIGDEGDEKELASIKRAAAGVRVNTVAAFANPPDDLKALHNLWQIARDTGGVCLDDDGKPMAEPKEKKEPHEIPKGPSIFKE